MSTLRALIPARPIRVETAPPGDAAPVENGHVTAGDLAELMAAFNEVTSRLQGTHETLQREVARLREELRAANEQLQRTRRLAALGEMAAGIAHEVRNPLGSIRLYARMLEQDLGDRPEERQIAGKIAAAVGGLDAVVSDVLVFSRELRVRPESCDPAELLTRALEASWSLEAAEAGIRVVRRHDGAGAALCDPGLMHQALVNVIRNALEAMGDSAPPRTGHELRLECGIVEHEFAFRIADTGPGVDDDVVDRMFNPFFTTRPTGTGLGLAIVHRIVDAHGGRIVVSEKGEGCGTVFELLLPMAGSDHRSQTTTHITTSGKDARNNGVQEARQ